MTVLSIIHEDDRLIAVSKRAGQLAVGEPDPGGEGSLHAGLSARAGRDLYIVHRLDRGTSGLILFAKDAAAHRHLSRLFEHRQVEKVYVAMTIGHLDHEAGDVDRPIHAFASGRMGVDRRGKPARTRYRVAERLGDADLLEVRPVTGRRHQIRVHLWSIGHPVLGDTRYGHPLPVGGIPRLMLHARELSFAGPDGGSLSLRDDPPADFTEIVESRRNDAPQRPEYQRRAAD